MSIVLVTGASGGIGSAITRELARRGATVALHYQSDHQGAEEVRRGLEGSGHALVQADLAEPGSIEHLWREVMRLGPVDALINNAGIFPDHPPLASRYDEWKQAWERTLAVNLVGAAHLSYWAARTMSARGQGRIVSVSSPRRLSRRADRTGLCGQQGRSQRLQPVPRQGAGGTRCLRVRRGPGLGRDASAWHGPCAILRSSPSSRSAAWPAPRRSRKWWATARLMRRPA